MEKRFPQPRAQRVVLTLRRDLIEILTFASICESSARVKYRVLARANLSCEKAPRYRQRFRLIEQTRDTAL